MAIGFLLHYLRAPVSHLFSLGHPWLVCFSWDSLALFLTLYSHGLLLTSLGFPSPITLSSFLRFMGLPSTPYFLYFHYFGLAVAHSHFSTSYTANEFAISLFPGSFKPIFLLKAHLLPVIHYSYRLGLMVFLSICQLFSARVVGLLLPF